MAALGQLVQHGKKIMLTSSKTIGMNPQSAAVVAFIQDLSLSDVPLEVVRHARYLMLDLLGVAAAGRQTRVANIICKYVASSMAAGAGTASGAYFV